MTFDELSKTQIAARRTIEMLKRERFYQDTGMTWDEFVKKYVKPKEKNMDNKGLYDKFDVTVHRTGAKIEGGKAFVLLPEKDPAAAVALMKYADEVRKEAPKLAGDIWKWLTDIELKKLKETSVPEWARTFFATSWNQDKGATLMLIEAGRGRGKTTLGIKAGIEFWRRHATYPPTTKPGMILVRGQNHVDYISEMVLKTFGGTYSSRQEHKIEIPTSIGICQIQVRAVDDPSLEGLHRCFDWLFFDNIDLMHPQTKVWRIADRLDPKMLILSQSVHTFASSILANKNEWNVLTDPTLL